MAEQINGDGARPVRPPLDLKVGLAIKRAAAHGGDVQLQLRADEWRHLAAVLGLTSEYAQ